MQYTKVKIAATGYELPSNVVLSEDLEERLAPVYQKLHLQSGQLEALTGIAERRFWEPDFQLSKGAVEAGRKALAHSELSSDQIGMLIYGGVCRENLEPATACSVAYELGLGPHTQIYDISNACLGILTGMVQIANAIELGQIQAGMVVSCESSRQIVDMTIERLLNSDDMESFKDAIATLTGGSGAAAVLLCDASLSPSGHRLVGGVVVNATKHHRLCTWGPDTGIPASAPHVMRTDPVGVLKHGVELGITTYRAFCQKMGWLRNKPDKIICHQVGSAHQRTVLEALGLDVSIDFSTYRYLGNMGSVSLPVTLAIAEERDFFQSDDKVGLFGIGSGLNCIMLGLHW